MFFIVLASAALLLGLSMYFDGISRLDAEFVSLQKRALRVTQLSTPIQEGGSPSSVSDLKGRFFAPGTLPDSLALASRVQASLKTSGLSLLESRVIESSATAQWVQYRAEGDIESWFRFLQALRRQDPQTLFRSISLLKKQEYAYSIAFEVGHAVLP